MKIVVCGNYGAGNMGDEMILQGLLSLLKKITPSAEVTVLSADPAKTSATYGVKSAPKFPAGIRSLIKGCDETKKIVKECDLFILGGGGLFGNLTFQANFIWGIQAIMAYRYGKPVVMIGQSIGRIKGFFQRRMVRYLFNKASFIGVRDQQSRNRLKRLKVRRKILVSPDLALYNHNGKNVNTLHHISVCLREISNLPVAFHRNISSFLDWIISKHNWEVTLINFQEPDDRRINEKILEKMQHANKVIYPGTIDQFYSSKIILGMRLHSIITAIKEQIPFIAINYASKVEDFLEYAGLKQEICVTKFPKLQEKFEEILKNYPQKREGIEKFLDRLKPEFRKLERSLKKMVVR